MKYSNRDVELTVTAKANYTDGFIRGFRRGQRITEALAQHEALAAMAFFVAGSLITLLFTKVF